MKCLIVLCAAFAFGAAQWHGAPAHGGAPAPVQDTPEVAAAKAAHYAALSQARSAQPNAPQNHWDQTGQWNPNQDAQWNNPNQWNSAPQQAPQGRWTGPVALPPGFDANGAPLPVQDTPEVAALKAAQLNILSRSGGNVPSPTWNPAPAAPAWNHQPAAPSWNQQPAAPSWNPAPAAPAWNQPAAPAWNQQPAAPAWNQQPAAPAWSGHGSPALPADTPEVAAAKAAHLAAHAAAGRRYRRSLVLASAIQPYTSYPGSTAPLAHAVAVSPLVRTVPAIATPVISASPLAHVW